MTDKRRIDIPQRCRVRSYDELRCILVADHCCKHVARGPYGLRLWGHFANVIRRLEEA